MDVRVTSGREWLSQAGPATPIGPRSLKKGISSIRRHADPRVFLRTLRAKRHPCHMRCLLALFFGQDQESKPRLSPPP